MKKIGLLCLALVLALGTLGIGYATWSDNVTIEEEVYSGDLCVEFASCGTNDEPPDLGGANFDQTIGNSSCTEYFETMCNPPGGIYYDCDLDKDIGSSNCTREKSPGSDHFDTIVVTVNNTYPGYWGNVDFRLCNCGTIPWTIKSVDLIVDDVVIDTFEENWCTAVDLDDDGFDDLEIDWGDNFHKQLDPPRCWDMSYAFHLLQEAPKGETLQFKLRINVVQWNMDPDLED